MTHDFFTASLLFTRVSIVISKDAFLSAVDLIRSTMHSNSGSTTSKFSIPSKKTTTGLPLFANAETEKLALLSPNTCKSRLQSLTSMLSEQAMCALTDDELLDDERKEGGNDPTMTVECHQKPPPIPPRAKSIPSLMLKSTGNNEVSSKVPKRTSVPMYLDGQTPPLPPKSTQFKTILESSSAVDLSMSFSTNASSSVRNSRECSVSKPPRSPRSTYTSSTSSMRRISTPSPERQPYPYSSNYFTINRIESDSDSSDDFVPFVPPKRSRYASEPFVNQQQQLIEHQKERRVSSPFPDPKKPLKKSSPILTKRPGWYSKPLDKNTLDRTKRQQSEASLTLESQASRRDEAEKIVTNKNRSRSMDDKAGSVISPEQNESPIGIADEEYAQIYNSDDNDNTGGTMESIDYSKPFEHILWRRLKLSNGIDTSGSPPDLDRDDEDEDDDDEGCTYLDPKELEEYCEDKELSDSIRTRPRHSKVLSSTYLSLMNVQGAAVDGSDTEPKSSAQPTNAAPTHVDREETSGRNSSPFLIVHQRFKKSRLADTISCSGYSTDASSGFDNETDNMEFLGRLHSMRIDNPYGDLHTSLGEVACSENVDRTVRKQEGGEGTEEEEEEQIYEEIDQYSDTNIELRVNAAPLPTMTTDQWAQKVTLQKTQTMPTGHPPLCLSQSVPPNSDGFRRHKKAADAENLYATLKEISFQPRGFKRAPTLPPRRVKKTASLEPGRRKHYLRNEPIVPGVSDLNW